MQLSTNLQDIEVQCVVWCQHCFWGATLRGFILIFQNLSDIAELPGIDEDLNFSKEIAAKLLQCKAQRYTYNDY